MVYLGKRVAWERKQRRGGFDMKRTILLLGDPELYEVSEEVKIEELQQMKQVQEDLKDTLLAFRARYGTGRAIAAPQIR